MTKMRVPLLAMLLMGAIGAIVLTSSESAAAQEGTPAGPSGLTAESLKNGIWLTWTRGQGRYSHQEIYYYPNTQQDLAPSQRRASFQSEKANATYAFIPYTDLEHGQAFRYQIDAMRGSNVVASSDQVIHATPQAGSVPSQALPTGRATTHPSGLSLRFSRGKMIFEWTPGVSSAYEAHLILCRQTKSARKGWTQIHRDTEAVDEVTRKSYTYSPHNTTFPRGHKYVCRVMAKNKPVAPWPMTNQVSFRR